MNITISQAQELYAGLAALDGYERAVKDGERERVVREFYQLGGGFRLAVAKNMNLLKPILKDYHDARDALIREISGGDTKIKQSSPEAIKFADEERAMLARGHDLALATITEAQLKLDDNPIPGSVLAALALIIVT